MNSRLEFPQESVQLAQAIAARYKKRSRSRGTWAANLYDGHFLEINYGFSESLKKGKCGLYLHEIVKEGECFSKAVAYYLVARELGLHPKFYWASEMKDLAEGESAHEKGTAEHSFITVKSKKGVETMVDPFMKAWGKTTIFPDKHEMTIYHEGERKILTRKYAALTELSEQDILQKMEQNRSREGGRLALSGSQKVRSYNHDVYIGFDSEKNILYTKLSFSLDHSIIEPYKKSEIYRLETMVDEVGTFDFSRGIFKAYYAGDWGWSKHVNEQTYMSIAVSGAQIAWNFFEELLKKSGKREKMQEMGTRQLRTLLINNGLTYDFSTADNSIAASVRKDNLQLLRLLKTYQTRSVHDFLERARTDEISWRVFLRDAQYRKARDEKKSQENLLGYVYSHNEHEQFLHRHFEQYVQRVNEFSDSHIENIKIRAALKKGSNYNADRQINKSSKKFENDSEFFSRLVTLRKIKSIPYAYAFAADESLFFESFDIKHDPLEVLTAGLTDENLLMAGKDRLFEFLLVGASRKKSLFAKAFHSGLRKILDHR